MKRMLPMAVPMAVTGVAVLLALLGTWAGGGSAWAHAPEQHQFRLVEFKRPLPAPDFSAENARGGETALADFRGRYVLLNFWATWCVPCVKEMPAMERLYREFAGRPFAVVAVSLDEDGPEKVAAFVRELELTFTILLDPDSVVAKRYGVKNLPSSFLIDPEGQVIAAAKGERDWFSPEARDYLSEVIAPPGSAAPAPQPSAQ